MNTSKQTITVTVKYSDDKSHRYLLRKQWDKELPEATIIMINPTCEEVLSQDMTSIFVQNNLLKLGYGCLNIVNLYSMITPKINVRWYGNDELTTSDNDKEIIRSAEKSDIIIIAWGSFGNTSQRVKERKKNVIDLLIEYKDKMFVITDKEERTGLHPLTPSVRNQWILKEADIDDLL